MGYLTMQALVIYMSKQQWQKEEAKDKLLEKQNKTVAIIHKGTRSLIHKKFRKMNEENPCSREPYRFPHNP